MASQESLAQRQITALGAVREVVDGLDPEAGDRLRQLAPGGGVPNSLRLPIAVDAFTAIALESLARAVERYIEESKPRRVGRPRKAS